MGVRSWLADRNPYNPAPHQRTDSLSVDWWLEQMYFNGLPLYSAPSFTMKGSKEPPITGQFQSLVNGAYKRNGVVFSASLARSLVFSDIEFKYQNLTDRKLYGNQLLAPLETPAPGQTTASMLARMEQDVTLGGTWFGTTRHGGITRLHPDWTDVLLASPSGDVNASDTYVAGYAYRVGGDQNNVEMFTTAECTHWAPIPDPDCSYRGMSWLIPAIREIMADNQGTDFRGKFFDNGATPNMVIEAPEWVKDAEQYKEWKSALEDSSSGVGNAFKTLFLAQGSSATTVGLGLRDVDFKNVTGSGETRILINSRVPAVIAGISEGLAGSSLNQGNYGMARRQFGDMFLRPQWRDVCGALAHLVPVPAGSRLWFDTSVVSFLQEDEKDAAEIQQVQAGTTRQYIEAGFTPESVMAAIAGNDMRLLVHSGLVSVQLQDPTAPKTSPTPTPLLGEVEEDV